MKYNQGNKGRNTTNDIATGKAVAGAK